MEEQEHDDDVVVLSSLPPTPPFSTGATKEGVADVTATCRNASSDRDSRHEAREAGDSAAAGHVRQPIALVGDDQGTEMAGNHQQPVQATGGDHVPPSAQYLSGRNTHQDDHRNWSDDGVHDDVRGGTVVLEAGEERDLRVSSCASSTSSGAASTVMGSICSSGSQETGTSFGGPDGCVEYYGPRGKEVCAGFFSECVPAFGMCE